MITLQSSFEMLLLNRGGMSQGTQRESYTMGQRCWLVGVLSVTISAWACSPGRATSIENEFLGVRWIEQSQSLQLVHKPSARTVIQKLGIVGVANGAHVSPVVDPTFGRGQEIAFDSSDKVSPRFQVFPQLPFLLIRLTLKNESSEPYIVNKFELGQIDVDWGRDFNDLKAFGTGGLSSVARNPGSYAWLALVEPSSRNGLVAGWLTHDHGSGVLFSREEGTGAQIEPRLDFGRLAIPPGGETPLDTLALGFFDDARLGLEAWADAVARVYKIQLPPQPTGYCTWYSKPHGGASDEVRIAELARFAADNLAPFGFSFVQIDDKWQAGESKNGPRRNFETHDPDGPYPSGMKATANGISELGLTPGLWFMPFAGTHYDPYYADKQDWFVKRADGSPYETRWGGTCLDMTHPLAQEHLRSLVECLAHDWGFSYFKIDGLWTGSGTPLTYVNSGYQDDGIGDATFYDPNKTNIEAYREGLRIVRETAGPEVFILGCNGPQNMRSYGGAIGFVDAMRVGPDNGPTWDKLLRGPEFGSRHYFMHGRVWYNDPDPVYVRESMPLHHAQLICSWVAISGQLNVSSEWLPGLPPERLDILKRCMPSHKLVARPVDLFDRDPPRIWEVRNPEVTDKALVALFNWDEEPQTIGSSFESLGVKVHGEYAAFDYWQDELIAPLRDRIELYVPGQTCRILALQRMTDRPRLISTSRHVTQGIVDVVREDWVEKSLTLVGESACVAGDSYELRVLLPNADWRVKKLDARFDDQSLPVETIVQQGRLVRIRLNPPSTGNVTWSIAFDLQSREAELPNIRERNELHAK